jgi:inhibitor of cysteine peptidase
MFSELNPKMNPRYLWIVLIAAIFVVAAVSLFMSHNRKPDTPSSKTEKTEPQTKGAEMKKFASADEFQNYLENAKNISGISGVPRSIALEAQPLKNDSSALSAPAAAAIGGSGAPDRVSQTNIQVAGIDEPDILKTNGKEIYYSSDQPLILPMAAPQSTVGCDATDRSGNCPIAPKVVSGTKNIQAFPPENLAVDANIDKSGDLLLSGNELIVLPSDRYFWNQNASSLFGYDVTDPKNPKEDWNIELKKSTSIAGARQNGDKLYLVLKTDLTENNPCLLTPVAVNGADMTIKCTEIYHPGNVIPAEATYTAMIVDSQNGQIEKEISFVGSSDAASSIVYMSSDALYLAYYDPGDFVNIFHSFLEENKDLVPDWLVQKIANLDDYDISSAAKMTEIQELTNRFQNSLSDDDRLKIQNEMTNRSGKFLETHRRNLDETFIVKIDVQNFEINATGSVPGKILNQFSLDEYDGNLRVATTVGENLFGWMFGFGFGGGSSNNTANDVYILDKDLKTKGSISNLASGEQIYAVRFIEDKGYVVTFKQTDPFFVLDLSNPDNPQMKGELKIPGYSSYLHPIAENKILGVGEENNEVKVSLFDVSDVANPTEVSKYNLDDYFSEISQTHHAFLQDPKHEIFFLPGSRGGYVFSYKDNNLNLLKAIADIQAKRAVYINDYLYVAGENKLIVLNENNWEKVSELEI